MDEHGREHHSRVAYTSGGGTWLELILPLDFESVDQNLSLYFPAQMRVGISTRREKTETGIVKYLVFIPGCNEVAYDQARPPCVTIELVKLGAETRLIGTTADRNGGTLRHLVGEIDAYLFPHASRGIGKLGSTNTGVGEQDSKVANDNLIPGERKELVELWNEGNTATEVGDQVGLSPGRVRNVISNLRKTLEAQVGRERARELIKYHRE
jgi:hypothetical protein